MPFKKKLLQKIRLLYAEDEHEVRSRTAAFLEGYFQEVIQTGDGEEALSIYETRSPDMILTDIKMPGLNGIELAEAVRQHDTAIPIIMLTAHSDKELLLEAVKLKLEDYLVKPFVKDDLLAALVKGAKTLPLFSDRTHRFNNGQSYVFSRKSIEYEGTATPLTRHESDLIELLICKAGEVVTYDEIESYVYHGQYMSPDAIKTLVKKLRKKLPESTIKNIVNIGYRLI